MRATPRSGLYKTRPTLGDMLTEVPTLLQAMVITGVGDDTKDNVIAMIKAELQDLDTICQSAAELTAYLPYWSASHALSWSRVYDALSADYDPISNYNMTEEETPAETTETETPAETTKTVKPAETTETVTPAQVTDTGSRTDGIFGFDGGAETPSPADTSQGSTVRTVQAAGTNVLTTQTPGSESLDVDTAGSRVLTVQNPRSLTRSGNIGVTTSQQMIASEAELRARWNMVQIIVSDFRREICVGVW